VNAFLDTSIKDNYRKGEDVLIDTLLLSRVDFLLKCSSSVGEFAIYFNPALSQRSIDLQYLTDRSYDAVGILRSAFSALGAATG